MGEDKELVEHLKRLLEMARASDGRVVVEVQDDPDSLYELQAVEDGQYGARLLYRSGDDAMCGAEVTTEGEDRVRVRKTSSGLVGLDTDGEEIRVRLERR